MTPLSSERTSTKINVGGQKRKRGFPPLLSPCSSLPSTISSSLVKPLRKRTKMTATFPVEIPHHILVTTIIVIIFIAVNLIISTRTCCHHNYHINKSIEISRISPSLPGSRTDDAEAMRSSVITRLQRLSTTLPSKLNSEKDFYHRYHFDNNYFPTPLPTRIELLQHIELLNAELSEKVHKLEMLQRQARKKTKKCDMKMNNNTVSKLSKENDYRHRYLLDNNYCHFPLGLNSCNV